jgi:hypothetical protein
MWHGLRMRRHLRRERIAQQKKTEDDQAPSSDMFDRVAPKMSFAILKDKMQSETGVTFHQGTHLVWYAREQRLESPPGNR